MDGISRYFFLLVLETVVFMSGCGGSGAAPVTPVTPSSTYTVVAISDIHFNPLADKVSPLADPALLKQLMSPGGVSRVFAGHEFEVEVGGAR